ncbi:hypothetical protein GQ43DRAFT_127952 [Delitschia confertaspora ATCC 74209]|uniref:Uncharacterized protein n=1 Tax=Delitschia confertaspora ATCC 74209 TaxID=1513339 RepID=A0A9P4MN72_9PLEO|nr:hypothetical protein GQ43DRAFT_127952 [Delitschia confertaspora ATCC 74209]
MSYEGPHSQQSWMLFLSDFNGLRTINLKRHTTTGLYHSVKSTFTFSSRNTCPTLPPYRFRRPPPSGFPLTHVPLLSPVQCGTPPALPHISVPRGTRSSLMYVILRTTRLPFDLETGKCCAYMWNALNRALRLVSQLVVYGDTAGSGVVISGPESGT